MTRSTWIAVIPLAPLAVAHYAAGWGFVFDLAANISYLVAAPLFLIGIAATVFRQPVPAVAAVFLAFAAAIPLVRQIDWPQPEGPLASNTSILFCNLQGKIAAWNRLRRTIDQRDPDLIALVEAGDLVVERITSDKVLAKTYPYRILPQPGLQWPQVVLSRYSLELPSWQGDFQRYQFLYSFRRTAIVSIPHGRFLFTVEHPPSPRSQHSWAVGNQVIRLLGELVKHQFSKTGLPILIAGDFNTSPTGYRDELLREATGLNGDPLGGLSAGTWPSLFPPYCRLPLDRVWGSEGIRFTGREVLKDVGSDHRPILVHFRQTVPPPQGDSIDRFESERRPSSEALPEVNEAVSLHFVPLP